MDLVLKLQFTAVCTLKGLNMSEVVQGLVTEWLAENASPELLAAIQNESTKDTPAPTKGKGGK